MKEHNENNENWTATWKRISKNVMFVDDMILYIEIPKMLPEN